MHGQQRQNFHGQTDSLPQAARAGVLVEAATQLEPYQNVVRARANTATDSFTITLPPLARAAGLIFSIYAHIANSKVVTLTDAGDDSAFTDKTLDANGDHIVLLCDGFRWHTLVNGIA